MIGEAEPYFLEKSIFYSQKRSKRFWNEIPHW